MTISFIVTTWNVAPWLGQCLDSLTGVALPGDQIILVDDGSDDGTAAMLTAFARRAPEGVEVRPILLGTNTMGGVGIGANIGLCQASRETVFFVDGDDWLNPEGFRRARAHWVLNPADILLTNYLEFDESAQITKPPADRHRWNGLRPGDLPAMRAQALEFIGVPWRKFYRRAFLEQHHLRFPEGDFFFEDNPFHWAVCLKAASIGFCDALICYHRVNRPGQTMVSTGSELAAFFTHFQTIRQMLDPGDDALNAAAARWLLGNMSWHLGRLAPGARTRYAQMAAQVLQDIDDRLWQQVLAPQMADLPVWPVADRLRAGDIRGVVAGWEHAGTMERLSELEARAEQIDAALAEIADGVTAITATQRFAALRNLEDRRD